MTTRLSRRALLRGSAGLGLFGLSSNLALPGCSSSRSAPDPRSLQKLLPGRVLLPGEGNFAALSTPWNKHWIGKRPTPLCIVTAQAATDVQTAMRWAVEEGVPLVPRSGGHSYSGYSTTSGVLVDVSAMTAVAYDNATGRATLGGGARNETVYTALTPLARTITHGRCLRVGVAGLVLGGGVGFNMRRLGLTCDQLVETEVVLANGDLVIANATENTDLFWAARGAGGGNFGVHTSFTMQTFEAPALTIFNLNWTGKVDAVAKAALDVLYASPRELGAKFSIVATRVDPNGEVTLRVNLLGQYVGRQSDLEALFAPIYAIEAPTLGSGEFLKETDYWTGQAALSDNGDSEFMYERSHYAMSAPSDDLVGTVMAKLRTFPGTSLQVAWKGFLTGGIIRDIAPDATSFVHRKDWMLTTIELDWDETDATTRVGAALDWVDAFHAAMEPLTSRESYQNFIDDSQGDWPRAYHGANLERLVAIKNALDPKGLFQFPQSIPLKVPGA